MTIQEINKKLAELKSMINRKSRYQSELSELNQELYRSKHEEQTLLKELRQEQHDVYRLKKVSLKSIFLTLKGTKDYELLQEMDDVTRAKAKLDRFLIEQEGITDAIAAVTKKISEIDDCVYLYNNLEDKKKELLIAQDNEIGEKLKTLIEEYQTHQSQSKETTEAIDAGRNASRSLDKAIDLLQSAYNWGTFDLLGGGGIISHAIKYERIEDAQRLLSAVRLTMRRFQNELKDINLKINDLTLNISDSLRMFDFWFDNIFTDFHVLDKIDRSLTTSEQTKDKVTAMIHKLNKHNRKLKDRVLKLEQQIDKIVSSV